MYNEDISRKMSNLLATWKEWSKDFLFWLAPYYLFLDKMSHSRGKMDVTGLYKIWFGHLSLAANDKNRVIKITKDNR